MLQDGTAESSARRLATHNGQGSWDELFGTPEIAEEKIDFCPKFVPRAERLPDVTRRKSLSVNKMGSEGPLTTFGLWKAQIFPKKGVAPVRATPYVLCFLEWLRGSDLN